MLHCLRFYERNSKNPAHKSTQGRSRNQTHRVSSAFSGIGLISQEITWIDRKILSPDDEHYIYRKIAREVGIGQRPRWEYRVNKSLGATNDRISLGRRCLFEYLV